MKELLDYDDDLTEKDLEQNGIENGMVEEAVKQLLKAIGENPAREGLKFTPKRGGPHVFGTVQRVSC